MSRYRWYRAQGYIEFRDLHAVVFCFFSFLPLPLCFYFNSACYCFQVFWFAMLLCFACFAYLYLLFSLEFFNTPVAKTIKIKTQKDILSRDHCSQRYIIVPIVLPFELNWRQGILKGSGEGQDQLSPFRPCLAKTNEWRTMETPPPPHPTKWGSIIINKTTSKVQWLIAIRFLIVIPITVLPC